MITCSYLVSLHENFEQQSCRKITCLSNGEQPTIITRSDPYDCVVSALAEPLVAYALCSCYVINFWPHIVQIQETSLDILKHNKCLTIQIKSHQRTLVVSNLPQTVLQKINSGPGRSTVPIDVFFELRILYL